MIIICISSREGSTRLPGKALLPLGGAPLIQRVWERCEPVQETWICTDEESPGIVQLAQSLDAFYMMGDPDDVLHRMLQAADLAGAQIVVRVTGDNPFTDVDLMRGMLDIHIAMDADYTYPINMPHGVRSEIIKVDALRQLHPTLAPDEKVSDDVSGMLRRLPHNVVIDCGYGGAAKFTVDTAADLERANAVWDAFGYVPSLAELLAWWHEQPSTE